MPAATPEQLDAAERVYYGPHRCELGRTLDVALNARLPGYVDVRYAKSLYLMIDLNAVPPAGIEGVSVTDKAATRDGVLSYGAIGVGDTKMKIHRAAVAQLFESNSAVLDAEEIYDLALRL